MSRLIALLACSLALLAAAVAVPAPDRPETPERMAAAKSKKGKIDKKKPSRVAVIPGTLLNLYVHTTDLGTSDKVYKDDVVATFPGYDLQCVTDPVAVKDSGSTDVLLRFTFLVQAAARVGEKAGAIAQVKDDDHGRGTGELTITVTTDAGGATSVTVKAFGE